MQTSDLESEAASILSFAKENETSGNVAAAIDCYRQYLAVNPNDLVLILHLESLLLQFAEAADALRVLAECYTNVGVSDDTRGVLSTHIITGYLLDGTKCFKPELLGELDINCKPFTAQLYRGLDEQINDFIERIRLVQRFQGNDFTVENSPHYIIALPESASEQYEAAVGKMLSYHHTEVLSKDGPADTVCTPSWQNIVATMAHDSDLRPEIAADRELVNRAGALCAGYVEPSGKNLAVLDMYSNSRYVIWFREPKEQMLAFCRAHFASADKSACRYNPICSLDPERLSEDDLNESINYLIEGGYLLGLLTYMAKWLQCRDESRSAVITYESFMRDPKPCLLATSELLELDIPADVQKQIESKCGTACGNSANCQGKKCNAKEALNVKSSQQGFSEDNLKRYDSVFEGFLRTCSWGTKLTELYGRSS